MYKDLSLKEKAKVLLYGGKLGLTSVEDIAKLYDDAISHKFAEGSMSTPDWDPNNPYHYHTASGEKVVITPEDWEKHKGLPYFKQVEDAVLTELAAHPGPEYIINPKFSEDLRRVYKGNMGPSYQNYSSFSGNLPQGYSFTPEGLVLDNQGNLYVLKGFRQTPRFTYDENNPLVFPVLEGRNKGNVTFYPVNMEKTVKPALPVSSTMNVNKERDKAISEYIKDNTTHSTVNGTMYKEPYFYPDIDAVDYDWEEWKKEHPVQELRRAVTKDYLYDLIKLKATNHFIFADEEGLEYDPFYFGEDDLEYFDLLFNNYINKPINQIKTTDNITKKPTYAKAKQKAVIKVGPLLIDNVLTYAQGGPIVSPYGQWLFKGKKKKEDTIVPSNNITMDNVNYPVLGISDTGDTKVMMPWNDYKFKGSMVYEHPLIGNQFQLGGNTKPTFDLWYPTVPNQKNDTSSYDLRRAYNALPFDEMEKFRTINDYHLPSVAYDEKTDTYTFLKRNGHPTLNYELDWYNSGSPDALEFRERYKLDTLSLPWRYIPRTYLKGGNTQNYLNVPEYNIALYNTVSPLGDFPNFWGALAYRRLVKDKLKNGNIYERDYKVGDTLGEKTAMAAWAKRLGIPYDEQDLPVYNGDTVTLPNSLVLEIPYDTNMLKTRIQLNKALLDKYSKYRYSDVVDAAIKADLYNLDKLRETYKTGKPVGLTEFGWNSRLLVNNGEIIPIENIQSPLNVLGNYNVRYSPEERRLYYSDEYDFNQFENFVPGEPYRIRGYIDLDDNKALGGNLFKKGGIYIKPENRGKFTALKKRTGHSASWFKAHGTPALKKMATFALNARHWNHKHDNGGPTEDIKDTNNRVSNWMRNWYLNRPSQLLDNFDDYDSYNRDLRYSNGRLLEIYDRMGEALNRMDSVPTAYAPITSYGMFINENPTNPLIYLLYGQDDSAVIHEKSHALNEYIGGPEGKDMWSSPFINAIGKVTEEDLKKGEVYDDYLDNLGEIYSRLNQVRYQNNLDPKHIYTLDEIKKMRNEGNLHLKQTDGLERYSDKFILHLLNDVAYNNTNELSNKALNGGHLFLENGQIFKRPQDDLTGRNILTSPILPPKSWYELFTIPELESKKPQPLQPLEGTYGNKYSELVPMSDNTYINNPINKGLQQDWRTHALEFAPFLAIGAGPAIGSTATWLASKPALYNLGRMTLGSEIGGRSVDLASRAFTGNTWGLNVGNIVEGATGWNPNNYILGQIALDFTNPGYMGLEGARSLGKSIAHGWNNKLNDLQFKYGVNKFVENTEYPTYQFDNLTNYRSNVKTRKVIDRVIKDNPSLSYEQKQLLRYAAKNMAYTNNVDSGFGAYLPINDRLDGSNLPGLFYPDNKTRLYQINVPKYDSWSNTHEIGHVVNDVEEGLFSSKHGIIPGYRYNSTDLLGNKNELFSDIFANMYSKRKPFDYLTFLKGNPWSLLNRVDATRNYIFDEGFLNVIGKTDGQIVKDPTKIKVKLLPLTTDNSKKIVHTLDEDDVNYSIKGLVSDLLEPTQSFRNMIRGEKMYKAMTKGKSLPYFTKGVDYESIPISDRTKLIFENYIMPRMKANHPEINEDNILQRLYNTPNYLVREDLFPLVTHTKNALAISNSNENVHSAFYDQLTKSLQHTEPYTDSHELRHTLLRIVGPNKEELKILKKAYGSSGVKPTEFETMNLDGRTALFQKNKLRKKDGTFFEFDDIDLKTQNKIIQNYPDKQFIETIYDSDGYWGYYIDDIVDKSGIDGPFEYVIDELLKTPEFKQTVLNWKDAMKYVGAVAVPTTIVNKSKKKD